MSLRPKSLAINREQVGWPGKRSETSIAMIDTGGGPVFLSDPDNSLWPRQFSTSIGLPDWIGGSYCCQAINANLGITLWDGVNVEHRNDDEQYYYVDDLDQVSDTCISRPLWSRSSSAPPTGLPT